MVRRSIAEAEAARAKAMSEKGGAAAAVSALTAKAKLAGMWREKLDQHNTGNPVYERIERVIVERGPPSAPESIPEENTYDEPSTEVLREMPGRHRIWEQHDESLEAFEKRVEEEAKALHQTRSGD